MSLRSWLVGCSPNRHETDVLSTLTLTGVRAAKATAVASGEWHEYTLLHITYRLYRMNAELYPVLTNLYQSAYTKGTRYTAHGTRHGTASQRPAASYARPQTCSWSALASARALRHCAMCHSRRVNLLDLRQRQHNLPPVAGAVVGLARVALEVHGLEVGEDGELRVQCREEVGDLVAGCLGCSALPERRGKLGGGGGGDRRGQGGRRVIWLIEVGLGKTASTFPPCARGRVFSVRHSGTAPVKKTLVSEDTERDTVLPA